MNLLITGAWQQAREHIEAIESMGHTVRFLQFEKDPLPCDDAWVEGVVGNGFFQSHPIESFPNLRFIQLTSAGLDRIPMDYVQAHGIEIHNAKGVYSIPMAEFAVAGVLSLYKKMAFFRDNQKKHHWEKHRGLVELYGKTVVIVGCGDVGRECARRFRAFGCRVVGVNRTVRKEADFTEMLPLTELDSALPEADVLVLAAALTKETRHLMNASRLRLLKNTAILVNISRGGILDSKALIPMLPAIGGAILDTFEEEPLGVNDPRWDMENVIITPHNSFVGDGNQERLTRLVLNGLRDAGRKGRTV